MSAKHAIFLHAKSILASPLRYRDARRARAAMGDQKARWTDIANFDPAWDARTKLIAGMIAPHSSVLEFGSGREQLEAMLPAGCSYQPCDITARSPRTLVCDLNQGFPELAQHYDAIVFSGVIEYIHDLDALFHAVRTHATTCIVSYATTDQLDCIATRMTHGWVNHLSHAALVALVARAGFTVSETRPWQQQTIYRLV